ncbi:MAG: GGDEF domain-containing protein, partial [Magnetococcales bacterium]|nr:GGDEF domain-containing protein [Magnetococcales bacterium]
MNKQMSFIFRYQLHILALACLYYLTGKASFKMVNDTYGHQVGDEVLIHMARIVKNNVRDVDIPGRWGGEEFLILCPETDARGVLALAEKLRVAVDQYTFPMVG